ncbi:MAG: RluA family pseudouridine synthase [Planctomycetales bacterium]|nr:RluA family pseudouridine synthase [Planctomycetales bacterium]
MPGETVSLKVEASDAGQRLDRFLAARFPERSRTSLQALIRSGEVLVNGRPRSPSDVVAAGDDVRACLRARPGPSLPPEPRPLEVLLDDPSFLVIAKPAGIATHPGAGQSRGTLVNALLALGGPLSDLHADPLRPGIVHRLDRDTTGVLLVAKDEQAHAALSGQFQRREVEKEYLAIVEGAPLHDETEIAIALGRDPKRRIRMIPKPIGGRSALTRVKVLERFRGFASVACFPKTGRTHQIRVHLSATGTPVCCDDLYGKTGRALYPSRVRGEAPDPAEAPLLSRVALHARRLRFRHPGTGAPVEVEAPVPEDLGRVLAELRKSGGRGATPAR